VILPLKRTLIVVISVLVASVGAMGAAAIDLQPAQAAGGGYVEKCGGGEIFLNEKEQKTFVLHNEIRAERSAATTSPTTPRVAAASMSGW
jgi:hypothetical protein